MLNFISLIIFLHVIPRSFSMENTLRFAFLNYFNIIRCDDNQIQYYYAPIEKTAFLTAHLKCNNKNDIFDTYYNGYAWETIELECSANKQYVREKIGISIRFEPDEGHSPKLPDPIAQIPNSKELYNLTRIVNNEDSIVFESNDQLVENLFDNSKKRRIFLSFPNYPIMCCLSYGIKSDEPCGNEPVEFVDKISMCYYNPTDQQEPSLEQWLAEIRQFMKADRPEDEVSYVLNLPRPTITDDDKQDQSSNINKIIDSQQISNIDPHKRADDTKKKQTPRKKSFVIIIIIIILIVALLAIIGGVVFFLLKKKTKQSLSPFEQIEKGDSNTSSSTVAESVKSIENDEIKTKQDGVAQKPDPNKRQRPESLLQFAFTNGDNLIRCSDNELQYYYASIHTSVGLMQIVDCNNLHNIIDNDYANFGWLGLTLQCSSDNKYLTEKIDIAKRNTIAQQNNFELPIPETKSLNPNVPYTLTVINDEHMPLVFESSNLPAGKNFALNKDRSVFLWFSNHPVICKISYKISGETLCDGDTPKIKDKNVLCYYDLLDNKKPSIEQFTAELKQFNSVDHPNKDYFLLALPKPEKINDDTSDLDDSSESTRKNYSKSNTNNPSASNQPNKSKKRPNAFAIIIGLIVLLVVITIIGTIAFFLYKKKKQSNSSSIPSEQLENVVSISSQSEASIDEKTKPNPTKQKRTAATMNFADDE